MGSDGEDAKEEGQGGKKGGWVGCSVCTSHTCELRAGACLQDMLSLLHTGISRCIVTTACVQRVENVILMYGKPVV